MSRALMQKLAWIAVVLTFCLVVLGAYVRLTHAGLGCPDWPGCYGQLTWPTSVEEVSQANEAYPDRPVEAGKAWREMVHRYLAGAVMILTLILAVGGIAGRRKDPAVPAVLPVVIVAVITMQAIFGMWTVTWKLLPAVVTAHLLGGMTTLALLTWLALALGRRSVAPIGRASGWLWLGFVLLIGQIFLGGWTSTNYAALACPDFPTCADAWWPEDLNYSEGFTILREIGVDYEGGVLDYGSRLAIHFTHRVGAVVLTVAMLLIGVVLWIRRQRLGAAMLLGALAVQVTLGIMNIVKSLPLPVAAAHNGGAALLVIIMVSLLWSNRKNTGI